jgi:hypothetical protein
MLNEMPLDVMVANPEGRIEKINKAAEGYFCISQANAYLRKGGEIFNCVNAFSEFGCGLTPACSKCIIRRSVFQSLEGRMVTRNKGVLDVRRGNDIIRLTLLVTAAPMEYNSNLMAVVLIEDISLVTQLEGLLPICSSCHKIRDGNGQWVEMEKYIPRHSEAQFTHDYCPECEQQLYSSYKNPGSNRSKGA